MDAAAQSARPLEALNWDNRFAVLGDAYASPQSPSRIADPYLLAFNPLAAGLLDLDPAEAERADFAHFFSGNRLLSGSRPLAMLYAGHQFGQWVPQLGDGRAILLGQIRNGRGQSWDVQLKGAGKTPYSRFADGRAVLRSTIREYLAGEAMAGLGIPTTRSLCIIGSDAPVQRETVETAAVLTRLATSHIRFGHFEVFFYRQQFDQLAPLADHVIAEHFPDLMARSGASRYRAWVAAVVERTAELIAAWQSVGFCHGVMNTDNMSVLGLTLDYGPYGFMDAFDPGWVCNYSDHAGRYAYDQQPGVGLWNLRCFIQAVLPLLDDEPEAAVEVGQSLLEKYRECFDVAYARRMRAKLGLTTARRGDLDLLDMLFQRMAADRADFTRVFRRLGRVHAENDTPLLDEFSDRDAVRVWLAEWRARLAAEGGDDQSERRRRMDVVNPKYVLRNYMAQGAIERAQSGDFSEIERLRRLLSKPCDEQPENEDYARLPPNWAQALSVSCSS